MAATRRLILDTGVLITAVRGNFELAGTVDSDDIAIPAITVAEFLAGIRLDPRPGRSAVHRRFLEELLEVLPVCGYDLEVAEHHAALLAFARENGRPGGTIDLIIAATARATGRILVTTDARAGFDRLPGVESILLNPGRPS